MGTQYNQSQYPTLMKQNCTHNPSTSQVRKSNHPNPVDLPYPPDPGEHVLERFATPSPFVKRDKLDLSNLAPPKGEMESPFSWTYLFKSPTSSTLCFGEPTLRELTQVKLFCNPISSTLCDFTLGKLNQETEFYHLTDSSCSYWNSILCAKIFFWNKPSFRLPLQISHHCIFKMDP